MTWKKCVSLLLCILLFGLSACGNIGSTDTGEKAENIGQTGQSEETDDIEAILDDMTLSEKIGQMMFPAYGFPFHIISDNRA